MTQITTEESSAQTKQAPPNHSDDTLHSVLWLAGTLMAALGIIGYLFWALNGNLVKEGNWVAVDFHTYYQAAQVVRRGSDIYTAGISPLYIYPPLLAIFVVPLSLLTANEATIIWKLSQHLFLLAAGGLLVSLMPVRVRPLAAGILFLGWLTVPVQDEIQVGESNSLVLILIVGAIWLTSRVLQATDKGATIGPPRQLSGLFSPGITPPALGAGLLLALAASIKVLPLLLIVYFWWRGPRAVAAVATGGFLLIQLILFALTPSTADYWFTQFPALFGQAFPYLDNQSLNALISRAVLPGTDPSTPNMQVLDAEALRPLLTWVANLLALAATIGVVWAAGVRRARFVAAATPTPLLLETGLALLTIHLVSGSTWLHHLVDLGVPILALLYAWWTGIRARTPSKARTVLFGAAIGVVMASLLHRPADWLQAVNLLAPANTLFALLASSTGTWTVIALWLAVAYVLLHITFDQSGVGRTGNHIS